VGVVLTVLRNSAIRPGSVIFVLLARVARAEPQRKASAWRSHQSRTVPGAIPVMFSTSPVTNPARRAYRRRWSHIPATRAYEHDPMIVVARRSWRALALLREARYAVLQGGKGRGSWSNTPGSA
jgi:hypothetical protein